MSADQYVELTEKIASEYRKQRILPVIGITGSVGKTTVKEMIASVLSGRYEVHKSIGSCNGNDAAVRNVLAIKRNHQICVFELGVDRIGQMERMVSCCRPTIPVLTGLSGVHLEGFGTLDNIYREKTHIFNTLPENGKIIVNGDDHELMKRLNNDARIDNRNILTYGLSPSCMLRAEDISYDGLNGSSFNVVGEGFIERPLKVKLQLPGAHMVQNAVCAVLIGLLLDIPKPIIAEKLYEIPYVEQRVRVIHCRQLTVIDDSYNASPVSVSAALNLLQHTAGRKVSILGDMNELGVNEETEHRQIGVQAAEVADEMVYIGRLAHYMYLEAKNTSKNKKATWYPNKDMFLENCFQHMFVGDTVLIKASHSQGFEELVSFFENSELEECKINRL